MATITCPSCGRSESLSRIVWDGARIRCECGSSFPYHSPPRSTSPGGPGAPVADPIAPSVPADETSKGTGSAPTPIGGGADLTSVVFGTGAASTTIQTVLALNGLYHFVNIDKFLNIF